jgi:hypothetical protein
MRLLNPASNLIYGQITLLGFLTLIFTMSSFLVPSQVLRKKIQHDSCLLSLRKSGEENLDFDCPRRETESEDGEGVSRNAGGEESFSGRLANIYWRAISIDSLRSHPCYQSLPLPSQVNACSPKDFPRFRQDSRQWDELHIGRLTTSKAAACLGFYEPFAVRRMKTPRSLSGHSRAVSAWQALRRKQRTGFDFLKSTPEEIMLEASKGNREHRVWEKAPMDGYGAIQEEGEGFPFQLQASKHKRRRAYRAATSARVARLAWGSAQEATALLVVLNYFQVASRVHFPDMFEGGGSSEQENQCMPHMREVGLLPSENVNIAATHPLAAKWVQNGSLPLFGASPDGLVYHCANDEGRFQLEIVEVKCSSPFHSYRQGTNVYEPPPHNGRPTLKVLHSAPPSGVGAWHVPQLMLEMFCGGADCRSAVLCVLSATRGAQLYRLHRDDKYIENMFFWLQKFYTLHVLARGGKGQSPKQNFFQGQNGYNIFLDRTVAIASNAELIASIPQKEIQRSDENIEFFFDNPESIM